MSISNSLTTRSPLEYGQSELGKKKAQQENPSKDTAAQGKTPQNKRGFNSSRSVEQGLGAKKNITDRSAALLQRSPLLKAFQAASPEKRAEVIASAFDLKPRQGNKVQDQRAIDSIVKKVLALIQNGDLGQTQIHHKPLPKGSKGHFNPATKEIAIDTRQATNEADLRKTLLEEFGESIDPKNPKGSRGDSGESFATNLQRLQQGKPLIGEAEKLLEKPGLSQQQRAELTALKKEDDRLRTEDDSRVLKSGATVRQRAVQVEGGASLPQRDTVEKTTLGRQGYITKEDQSRIENRGADVRVLDAFQFTGNPDDLKPDDIVVRPPATGLALDAVIHGTNPVVIRYPGSEDVYGSVSPGGLPLSADINRYSHQPSGAVSLVTLATTEAVRSGKDKNYSPIASEDKLVFNGDTEKYRTPRGKIVDPFASHIESLTQTVIAELALNGKTFSTERLDRQTFFSEADLFDIDLSNIIRDISLLALSDNHYIGVNVVKHPQHGLQLGFFETNDPNKAPVIDTGNLVNVDKIGELASRLRNGEEIKDAITIVNATRVDEVSIPKDIGKVPSVFESSPSTAQKLRTFYDDGFKATKPPVSIDNIESIINLSFDEISKAAENDTSTGAKKIDDALKLLYLAKHWEKLGLAHNVEADRVKSALANAIHNDQDVKDFIAKVHTDKVKEVTGKSPQDAAQDILNWLDSDEVKEYYVQLSDAHQKEFRNAWVAAAGVIDPKTTAGFLRKKREEAAGAQGDQASAQRAISHIVNQIPDGQDERLDVSAKLTDTTLDLIKLSAQSANRLGGAIKIPIKAPKRATEVKKSIELTASVVRPEAIKPALENRDVAPTRLSGQDPETSPEFSPAPGKSAAAKPQVASREKPIDVNLSLSPEGRVDIKTVKGFDLPSAGKLVIDVDEKTGDTTASLKFGSGEKQESVKLNVVEGKELIGQIASAVHPAASTSEGTVERDITVAEDVKVKATVVSEIVPAESEAILLSDRKARLQQAIKDGRAVTIREDQGSITAEIQQDGVKFKVFGDELTLKQVGTGADAKVQASIKLEGEDVVIDKVTKESQNFIDELYKKEQLKLTENLGYEGFNKGIKEWLNKPVRERTENALLESIEKNVPKEKLKNVYSDLGIEDLKSKTLGKKVLEGVNGIVAVAGLLTSITSLLITSGQKDLTTSDKLVLAGTVLSIPGQVKGSLEAGIKIMDKITAAPGLSDEGAKILQSAFGEGLPGISRPPVGLTVDEAENLGETLSRAGLAGGAKALNVPEEGLEVAEKALAKTVGSTAVKEGVALAGAAASGLFSGFFFKDAAETDDKLTRDLDILAGTAFGTSALLTITQTAANLFASEAAATEIGAFTGPLIFVAEAIGLAVGIALTVESFKKRNAEVHELNRFVQDGNSLGQNFFGKETD